MIKLALIGAIAGVITTAITVAILGPEHFLLGWILSAPAGFIAAKVYLGGGNGAVD